MEAACLCSKAFEICQQGRTFPDIELLSEMKYAHTKITFYITIDVLTCVHINFWPRPVLHLGCGSGSRVCLHWDWMCSLDMKSHELESLSDCRNFCRCDKVAIWGVAINWSRRCHLDKAPLLYCWEFERQLMQLLPITDLRAFELLTREVHQVHLKQAKHDKLCPSVILKRR